MAWITAEEVCNKLFPSGTNKKRRLVSPATLKVMRERGEGPPFLRLGKGKRARVFYDLDVVAEWAKEYMTYPET